MSHYKSLSHFDIFLIKEAELRRKEEELLAFRAKLRKKMRTSSLTHLPTRREVRVIIAALHLMLLCMLRCLNSTEHSTLEYRYRVTALVRITGS